MTRPQRYWDARAALNFMLGGAGAGLVLVTGLLHPSNAPALALGLALIAAGLGAVWLEIGRKLRALHVLFNPFTSWMTREAFAAALVFPLGIGAMVLPQAAIGAALAAAAFLYCQARILRAAKGIPAWRAPQVVPLVVATGIAEGAGIALVFAQDFLTASALGFAVLARVLAWGRYRAAVRSDALEPAGRALVQLGTIAALLLVLMSFYVKEAALLAAVAVIGTGAWLKLALVTRAGLTQRFALPRLPVRGTR